MTLQELRTILYYVFDNKGDFLEWRVNLVKEIYGEEFYASLEIDASRVSSYVVTIKRLYISTATDKVFTLYLTSSYTYLHSIRIPKFSDIYKVKILYDIDYDKAQKLKPLICRWLRNKKDYNWLRKQALFKYFVEL